MAKQRKPRVFAVVGMLMAACQYGSKRADKMLSGESTDLATDLHFVCGCTRRMRIILNRVGFSILGE